MCVCVCVYWAGLGSKHSMCVCVCVCVLGSKHSICVCECERVCVLGWVGCFPFKLLGGEFMSLTRSLSDFIGIQVCSSLGERP